MSESKHAATSSEDRRSPFQVDPWEVARKHYERMLFEHLAAIMKAAGIQQIDVPYGSLIASSDVVEVHDHPGGRFYRIKGYFKVET